MFRVKLRKLYINLPKKWRKVKMIYEYQKYKNIADFIKNTPKSSTYEQYTIVHKCNGLTMDTKCEFNDCCFACLFCILNTNIKETFLNYWGSNFLKNYSDNFFKGIPVKMPTAKKQLKVPYKDLSHFTTKCETTNIQPWLAGILSKMSFDGKARTSMEVPVFNMAYDRNGRLDICTMSNGRLFIIETKTNLDDTLSDERFVEQHKKYTEEIEKYTTDYIYITVIGGKETDLYPENSPFSTSLSGGKSKRFYKLLSDNNIKFSTPSAIWGVYCNFLVHGNDYSWDKFLYQIFKDENCLGFLSAGIVNKNSQIIPK